MEKEFVTYEIALKLKELGFDEECFCTYHNAELSRNPSHKIDATPIQGKPYVWKNSKVHNSIVCAPLWQQVIYWLKEKHGIFVFIDMGKYYDSYEGAYPFQAWCKVYKNRKLIHSVTVKNKLDNENFIDFIFYSYEEAREQAILKVIEIIKNN